MGTIGEEMGENGGKLGSIMEYIFKPKGFVILRRDMESKEECTKNKYGGKSISTGQESASCEGRRERKEGIVEICHY